MKKLKTLFFVAIFTIAAIASFFLVNGKIEVNAAYTATSLPANTTLATDIDNVSIKDLNFDGVSGLSTLRNRADVTPTYSETSQTGSLVFKFKYEVLDTNTKSKNSLCIYADVSDKTWDDSTGNALLLRGDGTFITTYSTKLGYSQISALSKGTHDIEFGRIAILDSESALTGNYYVYVKVDNELMKDSISPYTLEKIDNKILFHYGENNVSNTIYDSTYSYEDAQILSVSDLKLNGNAVGESIKAKSNTLYTYDMTNAPANKSVIFTADYEYSAKLDSQIRIIGDNTLGWDNATYAYLYNGENKFHLGKTNTEGNFSGNTEVKVTNLVAPSTHRVEYGRLAIMNGDTFTGKYRTYIKLDGKLIDSYEGAIKSSIANGGIMHFTGDGNSITIKDAYYDETAKEISVSDLKKDGSTVDQPLVLNKTHELTYSNDDHSTNYSLVFKCFLVASNPTTHNFHFINRNHKYSSASSFCLTTSKCYLGKSDTTNIEYDRFKETSNFSMETNGIYEIEFGRIAKMCGNIFLGYKTYVKINGEIKLEYENDILYDIVSDNFVKITGSNDGTDAIYDIDSESINVVKIGDSTKYYLGNETDIVIPETDPTKASTVSKHYTFTGWYDGDTKLVAGTKATKDVTYTAKFDEEDHTFGDWTVTQAATCEATGSRKKVCTCGYELTETIEKVPHTLTKTDKVNKTCDTDGTEAYWTCSGCGKLFSDANGTTVITEPITINAGHDMVQHVAKAATCTEAGNVAHYHCTGCNKNYEDQNGATEITTDVVIAALGHSMGEKVAAKAATCTEAGNPEYYHCSECNKNFADQNGDTVVSDIVIPALGHNMGTQVAAKAPTCTEAGNRAHYHCSGCNKNFADENGETEIANVVIAAKGHHIDEEDGHCPAKAATCTANGNVEYYYCDNCEKYFADQAGTTEIDEEDLIVAAKGHTYGEDGVCTVCQAKDPDYVEPSKKGCKSAIAVSSLVYIAAIAALVLKKKKEDLE